jgi:hypothetical protein
MPATLFPAARRLLAGALGAALCLSVLSCGGGNSFTASGSTQPTGSNVVSVIVDSGPTVDGSPLGTINTLFVSVTVCVPGTSTCQVIDHVQVDTGSYGLRILAPVLTIALPVQNATTGNPLLECATFVDGYTWGPVELADVKIGGETASSLPIHAIGDSRYPVAPDACTSTNDNEEDTVATFGANGILGIGPFVSDCPDCGNNLYNEYFSCTGTCTGVEVAQTNQVVNPLQYFATDNNGTIIDIPSVASGGATSVTGSLIFGVDTQSNNVSGSETVLTVNDGAELTAIYGGATLTQSFIDAGSNGIYFADNNIAQCASQDFSGFYCPGDTLSLTVTLEGQNDVMANNLPFYVGNAEMIDQNDSVFPALAGTNPLSDSFDFGLAFYFGRRVATVLEDKTTTVGTGPYVAF